jgi:hypothetical protein
LLTEKNTILNQYHKNSEGSEYRNIPQLGLELEQMVLLLSENIVAEVAAEMVNSRLLC